MAQIIDIHPHVVAADPVRYPHKPMHEGKRAQAHWADTRPVTVEELMAAMDKAHVTKAALVQAASCYSYDNRYLCDALALFPSRITGVGFVDLLLPDAIEQMRALMARGISGLRLFTAKAGGGFDLTPLMDERTQPAWELCREAGLSMSLQTDPDGMPQVAELAQMHPQVKFVLDHVGRPDLSDGVPYKKAAPLFALAEVINIYLKLTPRIMEDCRKGEASPKTIFPLLVEAFGAHRMAWGSNFPASEGGYAERLAEAQQCLSCLSTADREWIFAGTAIELYPCLA